MDDELSTEDQRFWDAILPHSRRYWEEERVHYKNGREAHNGDKVVHFNPYTGHTTSGVLYDAIAGNNYCNGKIAITSPSDPYPNLRECLHADDVKAYVEAAGVVFDNKDEPASPPA